MEHWLGGGHESSGSSYRSHRREALWCSRIGMPAEIGLLTALAGNSCLARAHSLVQILSGRKV